MKKDITKAIKKYKSFLISSHINPEGDSIGSQIALSSLLKRLHRKVVILNESPVPRNLRFMKGADSILKKKMQDFDFEAVIVLDCPFLDRIGNIKDYVTKEKTILNIDHHISNENFGRFNWIDVDSSSTAEMIFELSKDFGLELNLIEAQSIYVAIMTDTGSFKYSNTSSRTHEIVASLIDIGVKPSEVYTNIYEHTSLEDTMLLGESLKTMKVSENGKIAHLWVTKAMLKETKASLEGTENIINFARALDGVEIAILFRETGTKGKVKVSFRSKGKVDVNKLASFFDGGGHKTASGCTVYGKLEEVQKRVIEKAEEMLKRL